jgi:hypothetical protein
MLPSTGAKRGLQKPLGFCSIIKPFLRKHRGVCRKYLHLYVGFYTFVYNYKINWLYNILNMVLGNDI